MKKVIFKYYIGIALAIIAAVLLEIVIMNTNPSINQNQMSNDKKNVYSTSNISTDGYTVDGNKFTPTTEDPKLIIDISDYKLDISSISVNFEKTSNLLASVQVFYGRSNNFTETNSEILYAPTYSNIYMSNLPTDKYNYLRLDINSEFTLESVEVSPNKLEVLSGLPQFKSARVICLFLMFILINCLLIYFKHVEKILDFFKRVALAISSGYLKILVFFFCSIAACGIMCLIIKSALKVLDKGNKPQYYIFACLIGLLISAIIVFREYIGSKPERFFALIFLSAGTLLCVYAPFNSCWDDQIHYSNALSMSFVGDGMYTKADLQIMSNKYPFTFSEQENDTAFERLQENYAQGSINTQARGTIFDQYRKIGYTGCAVGLFIGRSLGLSFKWIFIFGRLGNMIAYCIVVYFAIRKLKSGKMILTVIALLPTQVFLASSYTYDAWVTSFLMLGFAYFFSEVQEPYKKISALDWIIIVGSFLIGVGSKAVYFVVMGILLLMPKTKFKTEKMCKWFRFSVCAGALLPLATFALPFILVGPGIGDTRGGTDVNSLEQVKYILANPFEYAKTFFRFIKGYLSFEQSSGFMNFLAYLGMSDHHLVLLALLTGVALTDKNEYDQLTSNVLFKSITSFFCFIAVLLVVTALYISFTAVGSDSVAGCQPRYLLPLVFPFIFVIGFPKIKNNVNKAIYNTVAFVVSGFVLFNGIWDVCIKMYF